MKATLHTSQGDINLELFPDRAPNTVKNFADLAQGNREWEHPGTGLRQAKPFYDGLIFHRVIDGFMIQGGCPLGIGSGGPGYSFNDEITDQDNFDEPYILAMANAGTHGGKGTNGSQFFITVGPTPHLVGKHTIFGQVTDEASRKVVDAIAGAATDMRDRPSTDIVINSVTIVE